MFWLLRLSLPFSCPITQLHRNLHTVKGGEAYSKLIMSVRTSFLPALKLNMLTFRPGGILLLGTSLTLLYSLVEGGNVHPWNSPVIIAVRVLFVYC